MSREHVTWNRPNLGEKQQNEETEQPTTIDSLPSTTDNGLSSNPRYFNSWPFTTERCSSSCFRIHSYRPYSSRPTTTVNQKARFPLRHCLHSSRRTTTTSASTPTPISRHLFSPFCSPICRQSPSQSYPKIRPIFTPSNPRRGRVWKSQTRSPHNMGRRSRCKAHKKKQYRLCSSHVKSRTRDRGPQGSSFSSPKSFLSRP